MGGRGAPKGGAGIGSGVSSGENLGPGEESGRARRNLRFRGVRWGPDVGQVALWGQNGAFMHLEGREPGRVEVHEVGDGARPVDREPAEGLQREAAERVVWQAQRGFQRGGRGGGGGGGCRGEREARVPRRRDPGQSLGSGR